MLEFALHVLSLVYILWVGGKAGDMATGEQRTVGGKAGDMATVKQRTVGGKVGEMATGKQRWQSPSRYTLQPSLEMSL